MTNDRLEMCNDCRLMREASGESRSLVAELLQVSIQAVGQFENGHMWSFKMFMWYIQRYNEGRYDFK